MTPDDRYEIGRVLDRLVRVPTRTETLLLKAELDKTRTDRYLPELKQIGFGHLINMIEEGDTLKASYTINIEYFGQVAENLQAFAKIIEDPNVVLKMEVEELEHGKSILFDLVQQITRVQQIVERRRWRAVMAEEIAPERKAKAAKPSLWSRLFRW